MTSAPWMHLERGAFQRVIPFLTMQMPPPFGSLDLARYSFFMPDILCCTIVLSVLSMFCGTIVPCSRLRWYRQGAGQSAGQRGKGLPTGGIPKRRLVACRVAAFALAWLFFLYVREYQALQCPTVSFSSSWVGLARISTPQSI
jgi:hypothetical protein